MRQIKNTEIFEFTDPFKTDFDRFSRLEEVSYQLFLAYEQIYHDLRRSRVRYKEQNDSQLTCATDVISLAVISRILAALGEENNLLKCEMRPQAIWLILET